MDDSAPDCLPYLKALSDDTRWQIVETLIASECPLTLGRLAEQLGISNYKASRHVKVLEEVGIVSHQREGRNKFLRVNEKLKDDIKTGKGNRPEILNLGCCSFEFSRKNK